MDGAEYITPLVFMIVMGTVLLNATTARMVAKALNVIQQDSNGILIIGANMAARKSTIKVSWKRMVCIFIYELLMVNRSDARLPIENSAR